MHVIFFLTDQWNSLTLWTFINLAAIRKVHIANTFYWLTYQAFPVKLSSGKYHMALLMTGKHFSCHQKISLKYHGSGLVGRLCRYQAEGRMSEIPKRAKVCDLCPRRHSFILQSPRNYFVCSDIANTAQLQSSWRCQCEVTVHRKKSALSTAGAIVTTHENSVMMWPFKGTELFSVL